MIPQYGLLFFIMSVLFYFIDYDTSARETVLTDAQDKIDAAACHHRAHAYQLEGDYDQALVAFRCAVELVPDDLHYRHDLALVYAYRGQANLIKGNYEGGLADLRRYVRLARDNAAPEVLNLLANFSATSISHPDIK